ncbi:MAG: 16S rRNA (guanine(966)-N(2))-methyltransferase RsmD [Bacillota bacterium]
MRIIAGEFRGFVIAAPRGSEVRPTSDRVREAVFNMLRDAVQGVGALDVFAGSGAMGLEALSRGASDCLFVDRSAASCQVIRRNVKKLNVEDRCRVCHGDVEGFLRRPVAPRDRGHYRVVFIDPPYASGLAGRTLCRLAGWPGLGTDALLVVESSRNDAALDEGECPCDGMIAVRRRMYGNTAITIVRHTGRRDAADAEEGDVSRQL